MEADIFLSWQLVYFLAKKRNGKSFEGKRVKRSEKCALGMPSPPPSTPEGREGARGSASLCIRKDLDLYYFQERKQYVT